MSVCVRMHQWWKTCICNTSPGYLETAALTFQPLLCCFWLSMANMFLHCRFSHIRNESTAHLERLLGAAVTSERPCVKARLFFQSFQYVKLWSQPGRKGPADSWVSEIGVCVCADASKGLCFDRLCSAQRVETKHVGVFFTWGQACCGCALWISQPEIT